MTVIEAIARIVFVGISATAVMDAWLALLRRMGIQMFNFAFRHRDIAPLFAGSPTGGKYE